MIDHDSTQRRRIRRAEDQDVQVPGARDPEPGAVETDRHRTASNGIREATARALSLPRDAVTVTLSVRSRLSGGRYCVVCPVTPDSLPGPSRLQLASPGAAVRVTGESPTVTSSALAVIVNRPEEPESLDPVSGSRMPAQAAKRRSAIHLQSMRMIHPGRVGRDPMAMRERLREARPDAKDR